MIVDQVNQTWTGVLSFLNGIIVPDWGGLVGLVPILLLIGVFGPILSLLALFWFIYMVRKPRVKVAFADPRRPAPLDADGNPFFPPGEPYSTREAMIYEAGATRSDSGDDLLLALPQVRPRPIRRDRHVRQLRPGLHHPQVHHRDPTRRPAARRRRGRLTSPDMAQLSSLLFVLGTIAVAIGFAAHLGHAVLLANGRRVIAFAPARQPAFATGGVTGSFVTEHAGVVLRAARARRSPPARSRARPC